MLPTITSCGRCVYCSFVSKHVSVSLLFVNKQSVSWSFVCQFKTDMLFAPLQDDTEQLVKFHHFTLGPHESMGRM